MKVIIRFSLLFFLVSLNFALFSQTTYCNPMNLDYGYTPIEDASAWGKHRATADPVIVNYKSEYYLFSTNQKGYWWSDNLLNWNFIPRSFLMPYNEDADDLCAPAVWVQSDTMLVFGSTYTSKFPIWISVDPKANIWEPVVDSFLIGGWDPAFFVDDDGKLYQYNGSSNQLPIYGVEVDRKAFQAKGERKQLLFLNGERFGWQRFGEHMDNTFLDPFIEGAWMTKNKGKYYLQYGAPGTEFSGYGDGVAIGNNPLGPFENQSLPFSFKAGGFARGAGHGSTFQDNFGNYWHVSTIAISVKNNFERRNGLWPAGFDREGAMYCNQNFGDYPHYLPKSKKGDGYSPMGDGGFTGWMLLNYNKPVMVSTSMTGYPANNAVDEDIKTYWSALTGAQGEWIQTDLGKVSAINAIQINYADQDVKFSGKQKGTYHQYKIYQSEDAKQWTLLVDKSLNKTDVPHDYIELPEPAKARFLKLENIHMPTGKFAISGFRVFGNGGGNPPDSVRDFIVLRTQHDKRSAWLRWKQVDNAYAYNIYLGLSPDKLYSSIMVYGDNEYWLKIMDKDKPYYFTIEAINENGVSPRKRVIRAE
jgi:xylan 1,4-beta-xylosidase